MPLQEGGVHTIIKGEEKFFVGLQPKKIRTPHLAGEGCSALCARHGQAAPGNLIAHDLHAAMVDP
jgi:hypothetical protein